MPQVTGERWVPGRSEGARAALSGRVPWHDWPELGRGRVLQHASISRVILLRRSQVLGAAGLGVTGCSRGNWMARKLWMMCRAWSGGISALGSAGSPSILMPCCPA